MILKPYELEPAVHSVIGGIGDLPALSERYRRMFEWAKRHKAKFLDFEKVKSEPSALFNLIGEEDRPMEIDHQSLQRALDLPNPTKRLKKEKNESILKSSIKDQLHTTSPDLYEIYKTIKSFS